MLRGLEFEGVWHSYCPVKNYSFSFAHVNICFVHFKGIAALYVLGTAWLADSFCRWKLICRFSSIHVAYLCYWCAVRLHADFHIWKTDKRISYSTHSFTMWLFHLDNVPNLYGRELLLELLRWLAFITRKDAQITIKTRISPFWCIPTLLSLVPLTYKWGNLTALIAKTFWENISIDSKHNISPTRHKWCEIMLFKRWILKAKLDIFAYKKVLA